MRAFNGLLYKQNVHYTVIQWLYYYTVYRAYTLYSIPYISIYGDLHNCIELILVLKWLIHTWTSGPKVTSKTMALISKLYSSFFFILITCWRIWRKCIILLRLNLLLKQMNLPIAIGSGSRILAQCAMYIIIIWTLPTVAVTILNWFLHDNKKVW